jgi:serine/threonine protein kinase
MKFADRKALIASFGGWPKGDALGQGRFGLVTLVHGRAREVRRAMKTLPNKLNAQNHAQDVAIREQLNHPLIVGFEAHISASGIGGKAIVTELAQNGALYDHLPSNPRASPLSLLCGDTRIATIIAGIVLGMRYLHSRGFVHHDLKPDSILLDWNWLVRIKDFSHNVFLGEPQQPSSGGSEKSNPSNLLHAWYAAPEAYHNDYTLKSDVYSFALILYEILVKKSGFSESVTPHQVIKKVVIEKTRRRFSISFFQTCDDSSSIVGQKIRTSGHRLHQYWTG